MASALAELSPVESLAFVAMRPDWRPSKAELVSLAADIERENPLLRAMARARHSYDGRLIAISESDEERRRAQVFDLYLRWAQMRGVVLARLYGRMAEAQRWTADSVTDFLASGVVFDADKLMLLRTGIERYFARDYVSSLHVLVPLFEDVLRRLRGKLGLNTTSVKPGSSLWRQMTLEEVLATAQLIEGLGADAIDYLRFLFVEQQGLNLRNEIAHGLLPEGWMQEPLVALVIDALLHLQPLYLTPTKEAVEQQTSERSGVLAVGIESQEGFGVPSISTSAPTTNLPDAAWIREMNDRIVHDFHPLRVILFGSRARGEAGPDSDVDLLVVLPAVEDRRQAAAEIRKALGGTKLPKDIIVTDPDDIAKRGDLPGTVLYSALREGRVLYDRE
jgi:predicted nucleotidyltransferase